MEMQKSWYSHGKLLISGEYLVMEGAKSFALPLKQGQSLSLKSNNKKGLLIWNALLSDGNWFQATFDTKKLNIKETSNRQLAEKLSQILLACRQLSTTFLKEETGFSVETKLDFNPEYGFGSSSTLISNIALWADVSPFELLRLTFGGSGYDIACARIHSPLFYQLTDTGPKIEEVTFNHTYKKQIYFVYLGKKQKSTESIKSFQNSAVFNKDDLKTISSISEQIVTANSLPDFEQLLNEHEKIMSGILKRPTVKSLLFNNYEGTVKSLGGWGGDFVLLTSNQSDSSFRAEIKKRGFPVVFSYDELVL